MRCRVDQAIAKIVGADLPKRKQDIDPGDFLDAAEGCGEARNKPKGANPSPNSGKPTGAGNAGTASGPNTTAQRALKDLVNDATNGGRKPLSKEDADTVIGRYCNRLGKRN